ncbi:hypothetical protein ASE36_00155 [Rhizobium sp. Root274]|uniref:hypothetical protein n=1 Tax=unclassified Rhizobium TaxID=2613769 RepID=UPI000713B3EC|nr:MULTISPECIES: hypothetical protein [unclassified Rhizobium]KQW30752.1 hypothetical protein ASC71_00155 [Rhizobium sp. Root1240]KRD32299.1 hypothetical protein ASE36_00155 [Rhizobium sp. Root274]
MTGINARTGEVLTGFPEVLQSLQKVFSTWQGERVMREWFGNPGLKLLGENQTEATVIQWFNILYMLTELFEPRYKISHFEANDMTQLGFSDFTLVGRYRPYAHLDWEQARAFVSVRGDTITLRAAN